MVDEMYYEESNVIPKKEYKQMITSMKTSRNYKPARISIIRKIYFNKDINYLTDALSVQTENVDTYCITMTDWNAAHLLLEKKSIREGLISKSYAKLSEEQFEMIIDGEYEWMKENKELLFQQFYLQLTINQLRPGVVVDFTRQAFRMKSHQDYMIFDTSIKSTYLFTKDTLTSPLLDQQERLESYQVVMTYKKRAEKTGVMAMLSQVLQPQQLAAEPAF